MGIAEEGSASESIDTLTALAKEEKILLRENLTSIDKQDETMNLSKTASEDQKS